MDGMVGRATAAELTPQGLYALLKLRVDVFVVEQHCAYPELDGRDLEPGTVHLWVGPRRCPRGRLRLLAEPGGERRIGRVCTAPSARGHGLSRRLLTAALQEVGDAPCVLDAQEHLTRLYGVVRFRRERARLRLGRGSARAHAPPVRASPTDRTQERGHGDMSDDAERGRLGRPPAHGSAGPVDPTADPVTDPGMRLPVPVGEGPTQPVRPRAPGPTPAPAPDSTPAQAPGTAPVRAPAAAGSGSG